MVYYKRRRGVLMRDRIAIISDIHGNLEALKTVLSDIKKREIDHIYCLGDIIAKGTHSHECIKLIQENCEVVVQGNCDFFFTKEVNTEEKDSLNDRRRKWNQELLTEEDLVYLKNLPYSHDFYLSGSFIRLFHATPSDIKGLVVPQSDLSEKYQMFLPNGFVESDQEADVIIYGHTHMMILEQFYNKTLINVGSVGNPINVFRDAKKDSCDMETTRANYLILEGVLDSKNYDDLSYQFVKVAYDIDKELNSDIYNIEQEAYQLELKEGRYRERERLNSFLEKISRNRKVR